MDEIKKVNKKIDQLMKTEPLLTLESPTTQDEHEMRLGLAQVYGNRGFRKYMEKLIKAQLEATLRAETLNDVYYIKGRILTLKELLTVSHSTFNDLEKLKNYAKKTIKN